MKINLVRNLHDEEIPDALPVEEDNPASPSRTEAIESVWGLFDVLLKAPARLDAFIREPALLGRLLFGFTVIVAVGFALYGLALGLLFLAFPANGVPGLLVPPWGKDWQSVVALVLTYPVGLLLATLMCLPSYWYFAHLGGARLTLAQTLVHSMKGKAATTVLLLGLLPLYVIVMLGLIALAVPDFLIGWGYVGLVLPFVVGLRGAQSVYAGFQGVVKAMTPREQRARYALPGWLMLMWAGLFTLTAPLVLFKLWILLSGLIRQV